MTDDKSQHENGQPIVQSEPISVDLPPPQKLLPKMAFNATITSLVGSTIAALSALTILTAAAMFIFYLVTGLFVCLAAYQISSKDKKNRYWIITRWNHVILLVACLVGSIWSSIVYAIGCNLMMNLSPAWRAIIPAGCRFTISVDIIIIAMLGLMVAPLFVGLLGWVQSRS